MDRSDSENVDVKGLPENDVNEILKKKRKAREYKVSDAAGADKKSQRNIPFSSATDCCSRANPQDSTVAPCLSLEASVAA